MLEQSSKINSCDLAIFMRAPGPILIADDRGHYLAANPAACELFELPEHQIIGKTVFDFVKPEDLSATQNLWSNFQHARTQSGKFILRKMNGDVRTLEYAAVAGVQPGLNISFLRDITAETELEKIKKSQAQKNIELKDQLFFKAFESATDIVFRFDEHLRCVYVNRAIQKFLSFPKEELLGREIGELGFEQHICRQLTEAIREVSVTKAEMKLDFHFPMSGSVRIVSTTLIPELNSDDRVESVIGIARDITAQRILEDQQIRLKVAEDAIRASEDHFRQLAESLPHMVWSLNTKSEITYINKQWQQFTGLSFQTVREKLWQEAIHPDDLPLLFGIGDQLKQGCAVSGEYRVKAKDGLYCWHLYRVTPIKDRDGQIIRWVGTATNIDDQKRARSDAEQANKSKSVFLANMSHEMRTPLNALIGFNELLKEPGLSPEEKNSYHSIIARNGELLLHLINDILDLSKVESGHLALEKIPVSLPDLLAEVTTSLNSHAVGKGLRLKVRSNDRVPETISTDPIRLKQILNNIIGNAIKFTESGEVEVLVSKNWDNRTLRFEVTDTGPGILESATDKLFKPFSQADPSMTRKFGGTGLGLSLSKRLAQSLGGDVWLDSSVVGVGSKFVIEIEGSVPMEKPTRTTSHRAAQSPAEVSRNNLTGSEILLVEDSHDNKLLIERYLRSKGASVMTAENGQSGVQRAMQEYCDLVLMDMQMPILDGYSATQILRKNGFTRPIIALTAHAMEEDREKCLLVGCTDYLTKPLKAAKLVELVAKYIQENRS